MKALVWLGLVLGGAALGVVARLYLIRRAKPVAPANARKEELRMPPELLLKEPVAPPPEAAMAEGTLASKAGHSL